MSTSPTTLLSQYGRGTPFIHTPVKAAPKAEPSVKTNRTQAISLPSHPRQSKSTVLQRKPTASAKSKLSKPKTKKSTPKKLALALASMAFVASLSALVYWSIKNNYGILFTG